MLSHILMFRKSLHVWVLLQRDIHPSDCFRIFPNICYSLLLISFVFLVLHDILLSFQKWYYLFHVEWMKWTYQNPHNQKFLVAFVGMYSLILNYKLAILIDKRRWAHVISCTGTKFNHFLRYEASSWELKMLRPSLSNSAQHTAAESILQIFPEKQSQRSETITT